MTLLEAIAEMHRRGLHTWTLSTPDGGLSIERGCYRYRDTCRAHDMTVKAGLDMHTYSIGARDESLISLGFAIEGLPDDLLAQASASTNWTVDGVERRVIIAEINAKRAARAAKSGKPFVKAL